MYPGKRPKDSGEKKDDGNDSDPSGRPNAPKRRAEMNESELKIEFIYHPGQSHGLKALSLIHRRPTTESSVVFTTQNSTPQIQGTLRSIELRSQPGPSSNPDAISVLSSESSGVSKTQQSTPEIQRTQRRKQQGPSSHVDAISLLNSESSGVSKTQQSTPEIQGTQRGKQQGPSSHVDAISLLSSDSGESDTEKCTQETERGMKLMKQPGPSSPAGALSLLSISDSNRNPANQEGERRMEVMKQPDSSAHPIAISLLSSDSSDESKTANRHAETVGTVLNMKRGPSCSPDESSLPPLLPLSDSSDESKTANRHAETVGTVLSMERGPSFSPDESSLPPLLALSDSCDESKTANGHTETVGTVRSMERDPSFSPDESSLPPLLPLSDSSDGSKTVKERTECNMELINQPGPSSRPDPLSLLPQLPTSGNATGTKKKVKRTKANAKKLNNKKVETSSSDEETYNLEKDYRGEGATINSTAGARKMRIKRKSKLPVPPLIYFNARGATRRIPPAPTQQAAINNFGSQAATNASGTHSQGTTVTTSGVQMMGNGRNSNSNRPIPPLIQLNGVPSTSRGSSASFNAAENNPFAQSRFQLVLNSYGLASTSKGYAGSCRAAANNPFAQPGLEAEFVMNSNGRYSTNGTSNTVIYPTAGLRLGSLKRKSYNPRKQPSSSRSANSLKGPIICTRKAKNRINRFTSARRALNRARIQAYNLAYLEYCVSNFFAKRARIQDVSRILSEDFDLSSTDSELGEEIENIIREMNNDLAEVSIGDCDANETIDENESSENDDDEDYEGFFHVVLLSRPPNEEDTD